MNDDHPPPDCNQRPYRQCTPQFEPRQAGRAKPCAGVGGQKFNRNGQGTSVSPEFLGQQTQITHHAHPLGAHTSPRRGCHNPTEISVRFLLSNDASREPTPLPEGAATTPPKHLWGLLAFDLCFFSLKHPNPTPFRGVGGADGLYVGSNCGFTRPEWLPSVRTRTSGVPFGPPQVGHCRT